MALKGFCLQVGVLRFTQDLKRLLQYLAVTAGGGAVAWGDRLKIVTEKCSLREACFWVEPMRRTRGQGFYASSVNFV